MPFCPKRPLSKLRKVKEKDPRLAGGKVGSRQVSLFDQGVLGRSSLPRIESQVLEPDGERTERKLQDVQKQPLLILRLYIIWRRRIRNYLRFWVVTPGFSK